MGQGDPGGEDCYRDGVIRSTGVFLRESSGAGTIQHVDLSLKQYGSGLKSSGDDTLSEVSTSGTRNSQSNAARRRAERRRIETGARKRRADAKAAEEALDKRRTEHEEYLDKLREKQFMERKAYRESLSLSRFFRLPVIE
ncbi:MAG: hypothetical protein K6G42_00050 [Lachnospiraceae bacterium]|nr:hypothetical protein [Lachnospiraceae bacterium]